MPLRRGSHRRWASDNIHLNHQVKPGWLLLLPPKISGRRQVSVTVIVMELCNRREGV